jgi:hypothetical protein
VLDGDKKSSIAPLMVTMAIEIFQLWQKVSLWHLFWKPFVKGFPKTCDMPPLSASKNIWSPSITPMKFVEWQPKHFSRHMMVGCFRWRSPWNRPLMSNSDQIFLIAKKGGHVIFFGKPLSKAFQNHKTPPPPLLC